MKTPCILFLVLAFAFIGCSAKPTPFSTLSTPQSPAPENWRTGYEWLTPQSDTPVMLVADYRHVLTANPPTKYTAPPVPAPEPDIMINPQVSRLDEKPVVHVQPPKADPVIIPAPTAPLVALKPTLKTVRIQAAETPFDLAWRRYCNNGRDMTDADRKIVADEKIPEKFQATCLPPK